MASLQLQIPLPEVIWGNAETVKWEKSNKLIQLYEGNIRQKKTRKHEKSGGRSEHELQVFTEEWWENTPSKEEEWGGKWQESNENGFLYRLMHPQYKDTAGFMRGKNKEGEGCGLKEL